MATPATPPNAAPGRLGRARSCAAVELRSRLATVRGSWRVILQATVAAWAAYAAAQAIGHEVPFFAPIAAIATVAISLAHRLRRAAELVAGNALGILMADLLIARIGTGAWQVALVVTLALVIALLAGGGPILIMQSSSAAILIATLTPPTDVQPWNTDRVVDALIGGGIGLAVSALLMPVDPAKHARDATDPVLASLADGYRQVAAALSAENHAAAQATLTDLRATAPVLAGFHAGLDATRESVRLAPWYWGQRTLLESYALAGFHLDNALRNLRVLARQAAVALDRGEPIPAAIPAALADLARGVEGLGGVLAGEHDAEQVRRALLDGVARTAEVGATPPPTGEPQSAAFLQDAPAPMFLAPIVGQLRLSASDLLQATGMGVEEAAVAIRAVGDRGGAGDPASAAGPALGDDPTDVGTAADEADPAGQPLSPDWSGDRRPEGGTSGWPTGT